MKMDEWEPRTRLGKLVKAGKITSMKEALDSRLPLKEPQIVDILLPELEDEVLDVRMVQRMTDSGRRPRFSVAAVVGNKDGFVGIGMAKGKEVGPTIRKAIDNAKLNIIEVKRGCGSWECGCGQPHSLLIKTYGRSGSARVVLKPAPRGVGLATGNTAKIILGMAGIKDVWGFTKGHTKTTVNYAQAVYNALKNLSYTRMHEESARGGE
jgi:small subunit ribosomal protein S5